MNGAAKQIAADWIGVDWGTTHLRAWALRRDGEVLAEARSDEGMATLDREGFAPALERVTAGWACTGPVIACGMVGSRQGWVEAPYARAPCPVLPDGLVRAPGPRDVRVIPGIRQDSPPDVMRGEETQIAGFLSLNPNWDGVACLPGTHTKWVHVSAGEVVSFQTFMTGEIFALLSGRSVLRHSVGEGWDETAFAEAVADTLSRPERLAGRLFSVRAEHLLHGADPAAARARLSGLLLGAELAAARPYWLGQQVAVVGAGGLTRAYVAALSEQGVSATEADGARMTRAGLTAAYRRLGETA